MPRPRLLTHDNREQSLSAWARERGIKPQSLWARLKRHTLADALAQPLNGEQRMAAVIAAYYAAHPDERPPWEREEGGHA